MLEKLNHHNVLAVTSTLCQRILFEEKIICHKNFM